MKTIKQIADEIGVSKQAVFYRIKRPPLTETLQPFISQDDGVLMVTLDGEALIKQAFNFGEKEHVLNDKEPVFHSKEPENPIKDTITETLVDMLKLELEAKNRQIETKDVQIGEQQAIIKDLTSIISTKDKQILELTSSLNAAQFLHAGTQAQLRENVTTEEAAATIEAVGPGVEPPRRRWWQFWKNK